LCDVICVPLATAGEIFLGRSFRACAAADGLARSESSRVSSGPAVFPGCQTTNSFHVALASATGTMTAGERLLTDEERKKQSANYLMEEIEARVAAAPIGFALYAQVAEHGDRINDPSIAWPDNRKRVLLGRLEIKRLTANTAEEDRRLVFTQATCRLESRLPICSPVFILRHSDYQRKGHEMSPLLRETEGPTKSQAA